MYSNLIIYMMREVLNLIKFVIVLLLIVTVVDYHMHIILLVLSLMDMGEWIEVRIWELVLVMAIMEIAGRQSWTVYQ
jgi:hypothetical protein